MTASPPISFDYSNFVTTFPEFTYLSQPQAQMYWDLATDEQNIFTGWSFFNCNSLQQSQDRLRRLMNLLTAHFAKLLSTSPVNGSSDIVGRVTDASEGSVHVSAEMDSSMAGQWFNQTKYGAIYWELTKARRTFRYFPGPGARTGLGNLFNMGAPWQIPGRG
jgi:hypothetical protein